VEDHQTGRRRRYERPEAEWVREERPDLAIISGEVFEATQAETRRRGARYLRGPGGRRLAGALPGMAHPGPRRHVLSGLLACGVCGGGFHAQTSSERYGCGWHRGRGPVVCDNALRVARADLEARVFGAIRERILVPEHVAYAVERALGLVAEGLRGKARAPRREVRVRLVEIDEERARLAAPPPAAAAAGLDLESLRPVIEARVAEMRAAFEGSDEHRRGAFRALLGPGGRMRVFPDSERRFRVEGLFELALGA
jgi:hypothetical protein